MYEFDSVSVSAFEAAELAAVLTEKSADGWDVAGIVTAGSDVVAYLRRGTASESAKEDAGSTETPAVSTLAPSDGEPARAEPVAAATAPSDLLSSDSQGGATSAPAADSGGTGWGSTTDTSSGSGWGTSTDSGSWGGSAQQTNVPAAAPSTPAVPAGWYADPAGRFELRYWDGGAWTEHVSRAGQQYTDPPVA